MKKPSRRKFLNHTGKLALGLGAMGMLQHSLAADSLNPKNSAQNLTKISNPNQPRVWFITGASSGFGLEMTQYFLQKGDKVVATSRNKESLISKVKMQDSNFLPLELKFDSALNENLKRVVEAAHQHFGRIDYLVNNAGYGLYGAVEETSEKDLREQFEVNVFAPFLLIQNALKIMRPQSLKEGGNAQNIRAKIFNLSSIAGFRAYSLLTPYCMSKFAISGLSEGLSYDINPFGIAVINVMPGSFRTEFLGKSKVRAVGSIRDYDLVRQAGYAARDKANQHQSGDPKKFAALMYEISRLAHPPLYLFVGNEAYKGAGEKIQAVQDDMQKIQTQARATDFD